MWLNKTNLTIKKCWYEKLDIVRTLYVTYMRRSSWRTNFCAYCRHLLVSLWCTSVLPNQSLAMRWKRYVLLTFTAVFFADKLVIIFTQIQNVIHMPQSTILAAYESWLIFVDWSLFVTCKLSVDCEIPC